MQSQYFKSFIQSVDGIKTLCTLSHVKMHLKLIGCVPIGSNRFGCICHLIYIGLIFAVLISYSISSLTFLFFNVKTFIEFMESAFWASRSVLSLAVYTTFVWHKVDLAQILVNLDKIVKKRSYPVDSSEQQFFLCFYWNNFLFLKFWFAGRKKQSIVKLYDRADQQASNLAKRIYIYTFILAPSLYAVPIIWKSCYNYIIFGNSVNTFQLFYPTRWKFFYLSTIEISAEICFYL